MENSANHYANTDLKIGEFPQVKLYFDILRF
jgi:hypothetical protein